MNASLALLAIPLALCPHAAEPCTHASELTYAFRHAWPWLAAGGGAGVLLILAAGVSRPLLRARLRSVGIAVFVAEAVLFAVYYATL